MLKSVVLKGILVFINIYIKQHHCKMSAQNKSKETVSIEEVTLSNMYEIEAIIRVLERKGFLTHNEVRKELKLLKEERSKKIN